jgi:hypothetical protein
MIELFFEGLEVDPCYCIGSGMLWLCAWHDVYVWVNSKHAIKDLGEASEHLMQVLFPSCAEACILINYL